MKFQGFYGNRRIKEYLENSVGRSEISNAYLITGPEGIGKRTLAALLARAIVCEGEERPCGICPACVKSARDSHPDIIHIRREKAIISVDSIRALKQDAYLRPNDGARKVYLIHEAETMNPQAQNALLKILEEPPMFTVFLLLCYNERRLLETVRSRCVSLQLAPLDGNDMSALLREKLPQLGEDERAGMAARAEGVAGRVLCDTGGDECDGFARTAVNLAAGGDGLKIMAHMVSAEKFKRDELSRVIDRTVAYLHDGFVFTSGGTAPMYRDMQDAYERLFKIAGSHGVMRLIRALEQAKAYCTQNIGVAHITGFLACEFIRAVRT